jgi:hypothetical protein
MARLSMLTFAFLLSLSIGTARLLYSQTIPPGEKQKIETLIKYVDEMSDTQFMRNGRPYDAKTAATFLRRKWKANDSGVKSAHDFIDKVATLSGTSGKPYIICFKDGHEVKSRDVLLAELKRIEKSRTESRGLGAKRTSFANESR